MTAPRLPFLTGARGLACLFVLCSHVMWEWQPSGQRPGLPEWTAFFLGPLDHHHYAVTAFIAISGYSLALPIAKTGSVRGGWRSFWIRRARRIWPPYLFSLLFAGAIIALVPAMREPRDTRWDVALPVTYDAVVAHVFLFNNLSAQWQYVLNPPAWSIATEAQLYIFFPAFIFLAGKLGRPWILVAAGALLTVPLVHFWPNPEAQMQLVAAFAAGVAAAYIPLTPRAAAELTVGGFLLFWNFLRERGRLPGAFVPGDRAFGAIVALGLLGMSDPLLGPLRRILESRWCLWIGERSYSIYLLHFPVMSLVHLLLRDRSSAERLIGLWTISLPLSILVGWAGYAVVERPTMRWGARSATM